MNERIKELAEQAEKLKRDEVSYRERLHNRYLTGDMEEGIFREKFAELIVRECMELTRWKDFDMSVEQRIRLSVHQDIKKHFGVK